MPPVDRCSPLTPETASCHDPCVESAAADAYQREILAFRAARETRYGSEQGWLTLVERIALEPGADQTPAASFCPLPPQANRLDVPVRAGERLPRGN